MGEISAMKKNLIRLTLSLALIPLIAACAGNKIDPTMSFKAPSSDARVGGSDISLLATSDNTEVNILFTTNDANICTVTGDGNTPATAIVHAVSAGSCVVTASQISNADYTQISKNVSFPILEGITPTPKATPTTSSTPTPTAPSNPKPTPTPTPTPTPIVHHYLYEAGAGGSINVAGYSSTSYSTPGNNVTAIPDAGYQFVKWSDNNSKNITRSDSNSDITTTALFEKKTFTITYSTIFKGDPLFFATQSNVAINTLGNGGRLVNCQSPCIQRVFYNDPATPVAGELTAEGASGLNASHIIGWYDEDTHEITYSRTSPPLLHVTGDKNFVLLQARNSGPSSSYQTNGHGSLLARDRSSGEPNDFKIQLSIGGASYNESTHLVTYQIGVAPFLDGGYPLTNAHDSCVSVVSCSLPSFLTAGQLVDVTGMSQDWYNTNAERISQNGNSAFTMTGLRKVGGGGSVCDSSDLTSTHTLCEHVYRASVQSMGTLNDGDAIAGSWRYSKIGGCTFKLVLCQDYYTLNFGDVIEVTLSAASPLTTFSVNGVDIEKRTCCNTYIIPILNTRRVVTFTATAPDGISQTKHSLLIDPNDLSLDKKSISKFVAFVDGQPVTSGSAIMVPTGVPIVNVTISADGVRNVVITGNTNLHDGPNRIQVDVHSPNNKGQSMITFTVFVGPPKTIINSVFVDANKYPTSFTVLSLAPPSSVTSTLGSENGLVSNESKPTTSVSYYVDGYTPPVPVPDSGYRFLGWDSDTTGNTNAPIDHLGLCIWHAIQKLDLVNPSGICVGTQTLHIANFVEDLHTVTSAVIGGGYVSPAGPQQVGLSHNYSITRIPNDGFFLESINIDGVESQAQAQERASQSTNFGSVTSDHTVVFTFKPNQYTFTFNSNFGNYENSATGVAPSPVTIKFGQSVDLPGSASMAIAGQVFKGWSYTPSGPIINTFSITPNTLSPGINLYAIWAQNTLTHSITASATVDGSPSAYATSNDISPAGVSSVPHSGSKTYTFATVGSYVRTVYVDGVITPISNNAYTFTNVTKDHSIVVNYQNPVVGNSGPYHLNYLIDPMHPTYGQIVLSEDASQTVTSGALGNFVEAVGQLGHAFLRWSDGNTNQVRQDLATSDLTVTAFFTP
jgi:Divergent InlB B-repeat domain/Listeria-Bacteroides repeat domain (List_Bact_rpt)